MPENEHDNIHRQLERARHELAEAHHRIAELESELEQLSKPSVPVRGIGEDQTEASLRQTEELFRQFARYLPAQFFVFDHENTLTYCNEQYAETISCTAADIVGKKAEEFLTPTLAATIHAENALVLEQNRVLEISHRSPPERGLKHWDIIKFPIPREGLPPLIGGFSLDVTHEKQAEEALRASEVLHRGLIEGSDTIIALVDTSGTIMFSNEIGAQMLRIPLEDIPGKSLHDLFPQNNADALFSLLRSVNESDTKQTHIHMVPFPTGNVWLQITITPLRDADNQITSLLVNAIDITTLVNNERALKRSTARLASLRELDRAILSARSLQTVAQAALNNISDLVSCQRAVISTFDLDSGVAHPIGVYSQLESLPSDHEPYPLPADCIAAITNQRTAIFTGLDQHDNEFFQQVFALGIRTRLVIGLNFDNKLIGLFIIDSEQPDAFTEEDVENALEVADQLAIGIHAIQLNEQARRYAVRLEKRVTERTQELERAKTRVEAILNSSSSGILLIHHERGIQQANPAFQTMFGAVVDEYFGQPLKALIHPDHHVLLDQALEATVAQERPQRLEARALRLDGSEFDAALGLSLVRNLDDDGHNLVCTIRDISKLKQAARALRESEKMLSSVIENIPIRVCWKDRDSILQGCNTLFAQAAGLSSPDEIIGMTDFDINPEKARAWQEQDRRVVDTGQPELNLESKSTGSDGSTHWIRSSKVPLRDTNGENIGVLVTNEDITERKLAEEALRHSEENFRTLFDTVQDLLFVLDMQGNIIKVNRTVTERLGYAEEELINQPVLIVHPEQRRDEAAQIVGDMLQGTRDYCPVPVETKTGQLIPVETYIVPGTWNGEPALFGVTKDISALKVSEEKFSRAFHANPAVAGLSDLETGQYVEVNQTFYDKLGFTPEEVIGKRSTDVLHLDSSVRQTIIGKLKEQGYVRDEEVIIHAKDGTPLSMLFSAEIITLHDRSYNFTTAIDITERKQMEEALRQSEGRLRSLLENMRDVVWSTEISTSETRYFTPAMTREIFGRPIEEFYQDRQLWLKVIHPEDRSALENSHEHVLQHGFGEWDYRILRPDGEIRWVYDRVWLVKDEQGRPIRIEGMLSDITSRKQAILMQQAFLKDMQALQRIHLELSRIDDFDALCRKIVEMTQEQLGVDRVGLFILDPSGKSLHGTYGVGQDGKLRNESYYHEEVTDDHWTLEVLNAPDHVRLWDDAPIRDNGLDVGVGWKVSATLWDGHNALGYLVADNFVTQRPFRQYELELFSVLGSTLGNLIERKHAMSSLREFADEIHDLYNNAPCGYHSLGPHGKFIRVNDTELEWLGYTRDEMIDKLTFPDIVADGSEELLRTTLQAFREHGEVSGREFMIKRKDGSLFPILFNAVAVLDENGEYVRSRTTMFDITELKKAQDSLRESEAQLRSLVESQTAYMIRTDLEGNYTYCNQVFLDDYGWIHEDPRMLNSANTVIEADHPQLYEAAMASMAEPDKPVQVMLRKPAQDGGVRHTLWEFIGITDATGRVTGVQCVGFDITKQQEAESALRESEERYRTVIETMSEGVVLQGMDGSIETCNAAAERILGLTRDQMMGRTSVDPRWQAIHEDGSPFPGETHPAMVTLRTGKPLANVVMGVHKPDGGLNWILINSSPVTYPGGAGVQAVVTTFTDISDRKRYEKILEEALQQEKRLSELKSRFVSVTSHEFRTPLAAILATTETLAHYRDRMDDRQIDMRFDKIRQQVDHMKSILEDVLQIAQIQAGYVQYNPVPVDLDELCSELVAEFRGRSDYHNRIIYTCPNPPVNASLDPRLMRQVISNLMSNALKYSPIEKPIRVELAHDEENITCRVSDEGIGIPLEDQKRLFEPFHRAGNVEAYPGTGLGLNITKEAVRAHGGSIAADSKLGAGTTMTVVIPRTLAEEQDNHGNDSGH
jgi:PAS domain S-box-containing protein